MLRLERAYVTVPDVTRAAECYGRVLGMPVSHVERGAVRRMDGPPAVCRRRRGVRNTGEEAMLVRADDAGGL